MKRYNDLIELDYEYSLYSEPDEQGNKKLIKRGIKLKQLVRIKDIRFPMQVFNTKGKVYKNKCQIHLGSNETQVIANVPYETIRDIIINEHNPISEPIGFLKGIKDGRSKSKRK